MILEFKLWVAKLCTPFPHSDLWGSVAVFLKAKDFYLQIILCALLPFRLVCQQARMNLAVVRIVDHQ